MIEVIVGTTTDRTKKLYPGDTTLRQVFEDSGVDYSVANVMLDGVSIPEGGLNKTLTESGVTDKCMLVAIVKAEAA